MKEIGFGDYVEIEQKRFGIPNEMYRYKTIGRLQSNSYVDVPVKSPSLETLHDEVVQVIACICCGVQEKDVRNFRIEDVKSVDLPKAPETTEPLNEVKADKGILTEEELKEKEQAFKTGVMPTWEFDQIISSHRQLFTANAELSFEKNIYKRALQRIVCSNLSMPDYVFVTANNALEELK